MLKSKILEIFLLVQHPYPEIEITCKGDPEYIRYLQVCRKPGDPPVKQNGQYYKNEKGYKP